MTRMADCYCVSVMVYEGAERLYVQVAFALGSEETRQREYSVLEDVRSADGKILLTMDRLDMSDGTIRHMYIPDFLAPQS